MPNATPEFLTCVRFSSPGITVTAVVQRQLAHTSSFVTWSSATRCRQPSPSSFERPPHAPTGSASALRRSGSHSPSRSRSAATVGTIRQHRSHFTPSALLTCTARGRPRRAFATRPHSTSDTMNSIGRLSSYFRSSARSSPRRDDLHRAAERGAEHLVLPLRLDLRVHGVAQRQQLLPVARPARRSTNASASRDGKLREVHRDLALAGQRLHNCSAVTGRIGATSRASRPRCGTSPSARSGARRLRRERVEPVLRDVHVERAEVHRGECVQRVATRWNSNAS